MTATTPQTGSASLAAGGEAPRYMISEVAAQVPPGPEVRRRLSQSQLRTAV
jgi:hypothetical protein